MDVAYGAIVDRRRLSHSGESVGMLLQRLGGRPVPRPGERPEDLDGHVLLDPLLEPYAFVLPDAIDTLGPRLGPLVEVGSLWQPGEAQPAWAELLRARRISSRATARAGCACSCRGRIPRRRRRPTGRPAPPRRARRPRSRRSRRPGPCYGTCSPPRSGGSPGWGAARAGPARSRRGRLLPRGPPSSARSTPYRHFPARTLFQLGTRPFRTKVDDTRGRGPLPPVDLAAWRAFLDRGLLFEGGRLDPDGAIRLLGSETAATPTLLGRPLALADFAVAYRAVFHGGLGEPYMSLDRGGAPQTSLVNYGGRLQDTSLGLVSLLCDIRFKTFSLGIDVVTGRDIREALRRELPSFRTHQERFASDRRSAGVFTQQTRLWFYPDSVDLTLSPQNDVLVLRRPRMSAASERIQQDSQAAGRAPDPPWTAETVAAINKEYDRLESGLPRARRSRPGRAAALVLHVAQGGGRAWHAAARPGCSARARAAGAAHPAPLPPAARVQRAAPVRRAGRGAGLQPDLRRRGARCAAAPLGPAAAGRAAIPPRAGRARPAAGGSRGARAGARGVQPGDP